MEEVYAADDGTCQSEDTNKFDAVVQALEGEDSSSRPWVLNTSKRNSSTLACSLGLASSSRCSTLTGVLRVVQSS
jgi:hypothetical protein